jgi:hypothetical protein
MSTPWQTLDDTLAAARAISALIMLSCDKLPPTGECHDPEIEQIPPMAVIFAIAAGALVHVEDGSAKEALYQQSPPGP